MPTPKVSIGLPVYNGERYLRAAVDSILSQDYTDFELIISDNASTDATEAICREYAARDGRIRYHRNEVNLGAAGNHNHSLALARGPFFKWASHDDVLLPGFLRRCVEVFDPAPSSVVLVAPKSEIIDEHGGKTGIPVESLDARQSQPSERVALVLGRVFWAPALFGLYRTEALKKTGLIRAFFATDYVLLVEMSLLGEIWEVPEVLFQRRFHPGVSTRINRNWRELQAWFDPSQKGFKRFIPPYTRLALEFLSSMKRIPMAPGERLRCWKTVFSVWYPRQWRRVSAECKNRIALRSRLKRAFGRASL